MKYLMGIDNGGTFSKAALFDEDGRQVSVASVPTVTLTPKPGYTERNLEDLWQVNAQAIREAIRLAADPSTGCKGFDPRDIAGVSFSGHGKGLYLVQADGSPACDGVLSQDARAWEIVARLHEDGTAGKVFARSFQDILVMQHATLLAWFRAHRPEVLERTAHVFAVKDYIRFRLTGEAFAEYSDFSGSNLVNLETGAYDPELLALFGIGDLMAKLPPLRHSSEVCGRVTAAASAQTGLPEGIPCAAGMFDVDACGIASGLADEDAMCMIAGTWSINEYISRAPIRNGSVALNSMFCIPGFFLVEESSPTSAGNLEWFIRNLMHAEAAEEKAKGGSVYALADEWVSGIRPEDSDVVFLPFLNGSSENPLAKGTFCGLTAFHDKRHLVRAVFEGIVFSHVTHVRRLLRNRKPPASIRLSGGAAKSDAWVQLFADALQLPIDVIGDRELGCQGAAMAAGIAAGIYHDYGEAVRRTVRVTKTVSPCPENASIYERKYRVYRDVIAGLDGAWKHFAN